MTYYSEKEISYMNNREFFDQAIFKNNPRDVFRDLTNFQLKASQQMFTVKKINMF